MTTVHGLLRRALYLCALLSLCSSVLAADQLGDLTGPWQLFVDDHVIANKENVSRVYHAFEKHSANPLLRADKPWEGGIAYVYGTVLPAEDGLGYRMWYHSWADRTYRMLYATSSDGLQWDKPSLGLVDYKGSTANNILFRRTHENHSPQVIHTPWEEDPARRYKFIFYEYGRTPPNYTTSGYHGMTSADGVHWTDVQGAKPILEDHGDVGNFVWDPLGKRYVGWPKKFEEVRGYRRRCVGFSETTDFSNWPATKLVLTPDEFDDRWVSAESDDGAHTDFYGLSAFAYESMYIGFLWIFPITDGGKDGPIFVELVSSHDGERWTRQEKPRPPILPLGPEGSWDGGMVFTPNHPLVEDGEIKLYYGGFEGTHGAKGNHAAIGLATLRKDGFASLEAGSETGSITTNPIAGGGVTVAVNFRTDGGELRVEVLDAEGKVIPGYGRDDCTPLSGDHIDATVTWKDNEQLPRAGQSLQLRFVLRDAAIYSFRASP